MYNDYKPTYLIMVTNQNNNKFYNCFPEGDRFRVEYGRVDSTKTTLFYNKYDWDSKINSKLKKGYKDISQLKQELIEEIKPTAENYADVESEIVRKLISDLQRYSKEKVNSSYSVKSSAVTNAMVEEAQNIINKLINTKTINEFNSILVRLFAVIPRKMGNVKDYLAYKVEDIEKIIKREQDLLDVLRGQIYIPNKTNSTSEENTSGINLGDLGLVIEEAADEDIYQIKRHMGSCADKFKKAYRVINKETQEKFDKFVKDNNIITKKLLFHGSRNENFWSILKLGLKLRPANAVITGKMFGYGIYFAPKCSKSIGYTSLRGSYWASGNSDKAYMAIFNVAYGNPYDVYDFNSKYYDLSYGKLQSFKTGATCLHAHSDKGMLRNDEIVVYKEEQVTIKYLVEIGN